MIALGRTSDAPEPAIPSEAKGDWARGRSEDKATVYIQRVHPGGTA